MDENYSHKKRQRIDSQRVENIHSAKTSNFTENEPLESYDYMPVLSNKSIKELSSYDHVEDILAITNIESEPIDITRAISYLHGLAKQIHNKIVSISTSFSRTVGNRANDMVKDTKLRNNQRQLSEALKQIAAANDILKNYQSQNEKIKINDILRMVGLELLIENVIYEIMPESVKDMPALLEIPILELLTHYEEYFSWNDTISALQIQRAFSEFANKQMARDEFLRLYDRPVSLNDVIDELVKLYDKTFNSELKLTVDKAIDMQGRLRIIKDLHTKNPNVVLDTIAIDNHSTRKTTVVSAVDYSSVIGSHTKPKKVVDTQRAKWRQPVVATEQPPEGVAIPRGRNTRHMDIVADTGFATFSSIPTIHIPSVNENMGSQTSVNSVISDFGDATDSGIELTSPPTTNESRLEFLAAELLNRKVPLSEKVNKRLQTYRKDKKSQKHVIKTGKVASITTRRMQTAINLIELIQKLHTEINKPQSNLSDEEKTQFWDREIHRIFLEWYKVRESVEEALDKVEIKKKYTSSKKGGTRKPKKYSNKSTTRRYKKRTHCI